MTRRPDRFRWLPGAAVVALAWLCLFPVVSVDAYYHLATGRRILEERSIPSRGVGSATFGQAQWHDQEWGFQVVAALVGRAERDADGVLVLTRAGSVGLALLRTVCLAAALALLSAHMARLGVDALSRALGLVLAAFLTFGNLFWAIRPQIFTYLGVVCVAYLLERDREGARWPAWTVLAVVAVWSNLHGAFVIGIALLGAETLGEWIDALRNRSRGAGTSRAWRLTALTLLAPLAGCANPHGYHQVVHPFRYLLEPEIYRWNVEWSRPDFTRLPLFLVTLALLVAVLALRPRPRAGEALRCAIFTGLLLSAIRHLPLASLIIVPVVMGGLARFAREGGRRVHLLPTGPGWGSEPVRLGAAVLLVAAVVALSGAKFVRLVPQFGEEPVRPMPERGARFLARHDVGGTGFNAYRFGGFLMFRLYPREVVFMDGRNDLYGEFRDRVYNRILYARPGWRTIFEDSVRRYDVGWVLLEGDEPMAEELDAEPGWLDARAPVPHAGGGDAGAEAGIRLFLRNTPAHREILAREVAMGSRP